MKKVVFSILICLLLSVGLGSRLRAEDDGLDLNTDGLGNKGDTSSSLTDINGFNLFTDDVQEVVKVEKQKKEEEYKKTESILFTGQNAVSLKNEALKNELFKQPVFYNSVKESDRFSLPIEPVIFIFTIAGGVFVFFGTLKYYKREEDHKDEINFNIN